MQKAAFPKLIYWYTWSLKLLAGTKQGLQPYKSRRRPSPYFRELLSSKHPLFACGNLHKYSRPIRTIPSHTHHWPSCHLFDTWENTTATGFLQEREKRRGFVSVTTHNHRDGSWGGREKYFVLIKIFFKTPRRGTSCTLALFCTHAAS